MRISLAAMALAGLLCGCAMTAKSPEAAVEDSVRLDEPFDEAWEAIIATLEDEGLTVKSAERDEGLVRTGFIRFVASQKVIEETAEVSDVLFSSMGAMPRMGYALTVQARPAGGDGTEVRVTPHIEVYDYGAGLWRVGRTKGVLESHFLNLMEAKAKSSAAGAEEALRTAEATVKEATRPSEAARPSTPRAEKERERSVFGGAALAELEGNFDQIWDAALAALRERELPVKSADREVGVITTKVASFAASREEVSRVAEVNNVVYDDSGWTRLGYALEIRLAPRDKEGTEVRVAATRVEAYDHATYTWQRAVSTGVIERQVLDSIKANIRPAKQPERPRSEQAAETNKGEARVPGREARPGTVKIAVKAGKGATFDAPGDRVWEAVTATLEEEKVGVRKADSEAGTIVTKWATFAAPRSRIEQMAEAENVMYDNTGWTRIGYVLSIEVRETGTGETEVTVEATRLEIYTYATDSWAKASSKGLIEQQMVEKTRAKLRSR